MRPAAWTIVIPVKRLPLGKSRLRPSADDDLVLAIALDTIAAVRRAGGVGSVLVVTGDHRVAAESRRLGAAVLDDPPEAGLNPAFRHGDAHAGTGTHRGALTADLPALDPADLAGALRAAEALGPRRGFVADHTGTGTTLLTAPPGRSLGPHFGVGSAAAHAASGAHALDGTWPTLRLDVDTPTDLDRAERLGLGPRTRARRLPTPANTGTLPPTGIVTAMQGTVATFDPTRHDGTVLLDDGTELPFPAAAFDASGLRLLRSGQRVRLETDPTTPTDPTTRITRVALITSP